MINLRNDNQYFDEKATVFGRIIQGYAFINELMEVPRDQEKPEVPIIITKCGELTFDDKLSEEQATDLAIYKEDIYADYRKQKELKAARRKEWETE